MEAKYEVGELIKTKNEQGSYVKGHVVLVLNPYGSPIYYCSMYPGAMPGYEYVKVVDLLIANIKRGDISFGTTQALNKFTEKQLKKAK